jgi:hypothetical protein
MSVNAINQAPGGCGCPTAACNITFHVTGPCGTSGNAGASVVVKRAGVTINSGSTNGAGNVTLDVVTATAFDLTVTKAGCTTYTSTITTPTCGSTVNVGLTTVAGFNCLSLCTDPLPNNLNNSLGMLPFFWDGSIPGWADISHTLVLFANGDLYYSGYICVPVSVSCPPALSLSYTCLGTPVTITP